jgi:hypothetical protein
MRLKEKGFLKVTLPESFLGYRVSFNKTNTYATVRRDVQSISSTAARYAA